MVAPVRGGRASARPALRALAKHVGILPEYVDQTGVVRRASDATRAALLAAMGLDVATERRAHATLLGLQTTAAEQTLAPARVVAAVHARVLPLGARRPRTGRVRWRLEVTDEHGDTRHSEGTARAADLARGLRLPVAPRPGYYRVALQLAAAGTERTAEQMLVVTPRRCTRPADLDLGARGAYGLLANLYTLRSARNWGAGDFTDLCDLVAFAGAHGAAFVGVNPLHALANVGDEISPYSPLSRLDRNPLYLDVTVVPELLESGAAQARLAQPDTRARIADLRATDRVDYGAVMEEKHAVLRELHRTFAARHRGRGTARGDAYERFLDAEGESLVDFATFCALRDELSARDPAARDWHRWEARYRDRLSPGVEAFRAANSEAVDYHCYLQFELDRQLTAVAEHARTAGLALGVYQDLALGSSPSGADPWMFPKLFLEGGVSIGAPPDALGPLGQNWGLPPIDPTALARDGYRYWIHLVRAAFCHAGALRIDHVMGLFRQFWIPPGRPGSDGAYVRMPADDLLGILALESARARALVIGEDLGTVPAGLPREMARWGLLSMRVLYFGRDARGRFLPPRRYPARALVCANTHDMAPLAGYWQGRDLVLRRRAGQITTDAALAAAERSREIGRAALVRALRDEGVLRAPPPLEHPRRDRRDAKAARGGHASDADRCGAAASAGELADEESTVAAPSTGELCAAVHTFLARTPAVLVGVSLDDLTGEVDPVNLPGVTLDVYPSWSRKMRCSADALAHDPAIAAALGEAPRLRGRARQTGRSVTARPSRSRPRARSRAR